MPRQRRANHRRTLLGMRGRTCCYCGVRVFGRPPQDTAATTEHKVPRGQGGSNDIENLLIACLLCNNSRGDLDFDLYRDLVEKHGRAYAAQLANQIKSQRDKAKNVVGGMTVEESIELIAELTPQQVAQDRATLKASMEMLAKPWPKSKAD